MLFPIVIGNLFLKKELMLMVISALFYGIILLIGGEQHKRSMIRGIPANTLGYDVQPFKEMLKKEFAITTDDQLTRLDEIIRREIYLKETDRKYPFADVAKQLFVAIFTTGLLSYAFLEIREGDSEAASDLFAIYFVCLAGILLLGGLVKQYKDFGWSSSLNDISYLIQLVLLENSIHSKQEKNIGARDDSPAPVLPSRKLRKR